MPNYRLRKGTVQYEFWKSRAKLQMFGGGYGNGKTVGSVVKALRIAKDYPGANILIARATFPKLKDTIQKEFMKWCPPDWIRRKPTQDDNTAYLINGTIINFRYVAQRGKQTVDGNTTSNLLSATYDAIIIDQIEDPEITHKDFLDLLGRMRGSAPYRPPPGEEDPTMPSSGPRWMIVTTNPTHNWVYSELVKPLQVWHQKGARLKNLMVDDETGLPIMELFEGSTYTNAENLPPDFIKTQEAAYKGQMRERYLMGKWAAYEGLVHPDFNLDRNTMPRAQMLQHLADCRRRHVQLRVLEGYDFGLASPSCYMFAFIDDFGRICILDGYYQKEFSYTAQPAAIDAIRGRYMGIVDARHPIQADPDIFKRKIIAGHKDTGERLSEKFEEQGIRMEPASNEIIGGIAKVNAYLAGMHGVPSLVEEGVDPSTLIYVCEEMTWFIDEIMSYYWQKNPQGLHIDKPVDARDHAMNALKYMVAKLPEPSEIVIPSQVLPPKWMFWHEMEINQGRTRARGRMM